MKKVYVKTVKTNTRTLICAVHVNSNIEILQVWKIVQTIPLLCIVRSCSRVVWSMHGICRYRDKWLAVRKTCLQLFKIIYVINKVSRYRLYYSHRHKVENILLYTVLSIYWWKNTIRMNTLTLFKCTVLVQAKVYSCIDVGLNGFPAEIIENVHM